jgi:murein DD-endopeptidase MepM/ murein hydrolase activator NlpD
MKRIAPPLRSAVLVAVLSGACATTFPPYLPELREPAPQHHGVLHPVEKGQTLWRIARAYHVSAQLLAEVNDLTDPTKLEVGQALWIPGAEALLKVPPAPEKPSGHGRGTTTHAGVASSEDEPPPPLPPDDEPRVQVHHSRFIWPLKGPIASRFGVRNGNQHDGIDIDAPQGAPIIAADAGEVLYAGVQRGYGNLILLRHSDNLITVYAHNDRNQVKAGDHVGKGQAIAVVGQTGRATGPHLHFEVREERIPRNPLFFLP